MSSVRPNFKGFLNSILRFALHLLDNRPRYSVPCFKCFYIWLGYVIDDLTVLLSSRIPQSPSFKTTLVG
jgi:hypothetical protein